MIIILLLCLKNKEDILFLCRSEGVGGSEMFTFLYTRWKYLRRFFKTFLLQIIFFFQNAISTRGKIWPKSCLRRKSMPPNGEFRSIQNIENILANWLNNNPRSNEHKPQPKKCQSVTSLRQLKKYINLKVVKKFKKSQNTLY